jgi:hypothetical protein
MFAEYQGRFYSEIFFPYLDKHNIKDIIHLGDYFDRRRDVNFYSLHKNYEHFVQPMLERDITMDLIVGNHDIYFKSTNELNSPDYLLDFKNINVYKDPLIKFYDTLAICLVPWINSENYEDVEEFLDIVAGDFATEAEDTLTILTKHIDSLNIDGDKKKLDVLMRSLYTESLDILV